MVRTTKTNSDYNQALHSVSKVDGWSGWPTPTWLKANRSALSLGGFGSMSHPITGEIAGRMWTSFRAKHDVRHGSGTTTYYYTGCFVDGIDRSHPDIDLVAPQSNLVRQGLTYYVASVDDPSFERAFQTRVDDQSHVRAVPLVLTAPMRSAALELAQQAPVQRIRIHCGKVVCWMGGNGDARNEPWFPALLAGMAAIAQAMEPSVR
ncbi:hypothetical protein [Nocardia heshunensis]